MVTANAKEGHMRKVLITGFPHCGTSIVKSKLGECSNAYEHPEEAMAVTDAMQAAAQSEGKDVVLVKWPHVPPELAAAGMDPAHTKGL